MATNLYSQPPAVASDARTGWDRTITYVDGRVRVMRNYYLPFPIDDPSKSFLEKTYQFGTALDSYWSAGYSAGTVQLVDDFREGNNRVAVYSDGSSYVSAGWYERNPAYSDYRLAPGSYSTAPITTYVPPVTPAPAPAPAAVTPPPVIPAPTPPAPPVAIEPETPPIGFPDDASQLYSQQTPSPAIMPSQAQGIPPSDVTLPPNLSAPANQVYLPLTPSAAAVPFSGPVSQEPVPGVPSLTAGLGNLVPGVPNVPSTGPSETASRDAMLAGLVGYGGGKLVVIGLIIGLYYLFK